MIRARRTIVLVMALLAPGILVLPPSTFAQRGSKAAKSTKPSLPPPPPPATPAPPPETKPYDPQLMRLAEILGALTYLRGLCGDKDAEEWRTRMQALLDAEGMPVTRKDRLAGAFNRGVDGYSLSYRTCTANAHLVIDRFLAEGSRIAKDLENRYRAS